MKVSLFQDVNLLMKGVKGICSKVPDDEFSKEVPLTVCAGGSKTVSWPIVPIQVTEEKPGGRGQDERRCGETVVLRESAWRRCQ